MESDPKQTHDEAPATESISMDVPSAEETSVAAGGDPIVEASASGSEQPGSRQADDQRASESDAGAVANSTGESQVVPNPRLKWYAVDTYSGQENRARTTLLERIKKYGLEEKFGEVLVPTESVVEVVKGKRRTSTRKFYPGYMFVQMEFDEHTCHLVKNTPKITGFLGGNKPFPVKDDEIAGINRQITEGAAKPTPRITFEDGENVRVIDGPFSNFSGIVEEVRPEKQKVRVLVSIFGRATPVELDFMQVEKA